MSGDRIGEVAHDFQNIGVAVIEADAAFEVGDRLRVEGANDDFTFTVESMEIDEEPVERVEPGQAAGVKVPERVREGSIVSRLDADRA